MRPLADRPYFLYCVECCDGTLYTGISTDPERRARDHNTNSRGAKYTRARRPVKLVWQEPCASKSEALKREHAFKKLSRKQKLLRIRATDPPRARLVKTESGTRPTTPPYPRKPAPTDASPVIEIRKCVACPLDWALYAYMTQGSVAGAVLWLRDRDRRKFAEALGYDVATEDAFLETDACVRWPGALDRDGFGTFHSVHGSRVGAHRAAFRLFVGPIAPNHVVTHTCHNAWCVTPGHLRVSTLEDSLKQRVADKVHARAERHGRAKLSWDDVTDIRSRWKAREATQRAMAAEYGVAETTIADIVHRRTWKRT